MALGVEASKPPSSLFRIIGMELNCSVLFLGCCLLHAVAAQSNKDKHKKAKQIIQILNTTMVKYSLVLIIINKILYIFFIFIE
jgi:hypothetical protein